MVTQGGALDLDEHELWRKQAEAWQLEAAAAQRRLVQLQAVTDALASARSTEDLARVVETQMAQVLDAQQAGIAMLSDSGDELVLAAQAGIADEVVRSHERFSLQAPLPLAFAARERASLWLEDRAQLEREFPLAVTGESPTHAIACAPMIIEGELIGSIGFGFSEARHFDARQRGIIATLAGQAAATVERARRFQRMARSAADAERANHRLTLLSACSDQLARTQDSEQALLEGLAPLVAAHFDAECAITRPGKPDIRVRAASDSDGRAPDSVITAPLHVGEVPIGVLTVSRFDARRYSRSDRDLLVDVAARAALAIMSARRAHEARELVEQLREANRAKDEFLAILGHELRNPLAPLVTALDLAAVHDAPLDARTLESMRHQVEHLQRLVDDLLDVAKVARGKITLERRVVEVPELIARAAEMVAPLLDAKNHRLLVQRGPFEHAAVNGDPARLAQVFSNLLTNAAKYTDAGGEIRVGIAVEGGEVVVDVCDNGIGISEALLPRIFDMFVQAPQQSDRKAGGLGLGLALVQNLVQMHGGTVAAVSSGSGRGSQFTVRLPLCAAPLQRAAATPAHADGVSRRVLLVDDNQDAADLMAQLIAGYGHEVQVAYSGLDALQLLESSRPDVAVLDLGLPEMDGYELAQALRARIADLTLIALTGYGHDSDRERSRSSGFAQHFVKPVSPARLLRAIEDSPHTP